MRQPFLSDFEESSAMVMCCADVAKVVGSELVFMAGITSHLRDVIIQ